MEYELGLTSADSGDDYELVDDTYTDFDAYAHGFYPNPEIVLPEAGVTAEAGIGRVKVHKKGVGFESKIISVSGSARASLGTLEAKVGAEVASLSASTDPLQVQLGRVKIDVGKVGVGATALRASAGVKANGTGLGAMAKAEVLSVSGTAGHVNAKLALGFDSGVGIGEDGLDVRFLGTGLRVGRTVSVSAFNSEVGCDVS